MSASAVRTVSDVLDWYEGQESNGNPVAAKECQRQRRLFRAAHGNTPLDLCKPSMLWDFIRNQQGARSDWTRRRIRATINRPFNLAVELGEIVRNPFAGLRLKLGTEGRDWTDQEYRAVLRHSPPQLRRVAVCLRFSGLRPGEVRTLRWPELFAAQIVKENHKTVRITGEARRIPFNDVLAKLFLWLRRHRTHTDYVFTNAHGRPWTIDALTKRLRAVRRRAGLSPAVKMHGGRHTFATQAILNGVDIVTLAELLGHRSLKSTERYVHLANKHKHLEGAMNRAIGRAVL